MTQDEKWLLKYNEVVAFIENNKRNPSLNWIKHNKKLYAAGELKLDRVAPCALLTRLPPTTAASSWSSRPPVARNGCLHRLP